MKYPDWFKMETGFRFYDPSGDLMVLLGYANHTDYYPAGSVQLSRSGSDTIYVSIYDVNTDRGLIASMMYKGEISLVNLYGHDYDQEWWDSITPCEDEGLIHRTSKHDTRWVS